MKNIDLIRSTAFVLAVSGSHGAQAAEQRGNALELVAKFDGAMPTGVTVSPEGRIFVNYPQWGDNPPFAVGELKDGAVSAFPDSKVNTPDRAHPSETFLSVQSVVADGVGRLWVLDTGAPGFKEPTEGGAKLVAVDLATGSIVKSIVFDRSAVLPTTYLNDVRFDLRQGAEGVAYITDSSVNGPGAIIVVDLSTGRARRRLNGHPTTMPDKNFVPLVEGKPLLNRPKGEKPTPWLVASDGIAISPDGKTLYYCALSSRHLFSVPTDLLRDENASEEKVAAAIKDLGLKGASDGLAEDDRGRIYGGDYEHNAIRRFDGSKWSTIVEDPRIKWPDTLSISKDGYLYFTANQLYRQAGFNEGVDGRKRPYELFRIKIGAGPVFLRPASR
jgi:sugar lactone lactonase YvrE